MPPAGRDEPPPVTAPTRPSGAARRHGVHRSCTSTWTRSTPPRRCSTGPSCVGTPVIVGGGGSRGVVLSATYEARALRRRLGDADDPGPAAVPAGHRHRARPRAATAAISAAVMAIFAIDHPAGRAAVARRGVPRRVRGACAGWAARPQIGQLIRDRVADEQGITCSVGVAPDQVRRQARLRPGQARRAARRAARPRSSRSCTRCRSARCGAWGSKTEEALRRLGLRTVGDIAHTPVDTLRRALGDSAGAHLHDAGLGPRPARASCPTRREKEHRRRGDLRPRRRRPRRHPPRAAQALRPHGGPGPRRRHGRPHRLDQGAVRRLHDDHPRPGPCATPPTSAARSTPRPEPSSTPSACNGPGSGWSASASRASSTSARAPVQGTARRARARVARGRPGRRPGQRPVRCRRGASGQSGRRCGLGYRRPGARPILITGGRGGVIRHPSAAEPISLIGRSVDVTPRAQEVKGAALRARAASAGADGASTVCRGPEVRLADAGLDSARPSPTSHHARHPRGRGRARPGGARCGQRGGLARRDRFRADGRRSRLRRDTAEDPRPTLGAVGHDGTVRAHAPSKSTGTRASRKGKSAKPRQSGGPAGFMQRMEQRWDKRRGDGFR